MPPMKLNNFDDFKKYATHFNINITNSQLDLFKKHYELLLEWNKKINLISRKEDNILEKHFLDSIIFLPEINSLFLISNLRSPISILDIGSGGGFPAIPLAIMQSNWHFVLCESIKKKVNFLETLLNELGLTNRVKIINERIETLHKISFGVKNKYDLITARAVAKLDTLIKYATPILKKDGHLIAYKSKDIDEEVKNSKNLIQMHKLNIKIFSKEINKIERKLIVISNLGTF